MKNCLLCIVLCIASDAVAGRTISVPYIVRRTYAVYPPAGGIYNVPKKLGAVLTAMVTVKNISNTSQSVTVRHAPGSYAYSNTTDLDVCLGMTGSANKITSTGGIARAPLLNVNDVHRTLEIPPNSLQTFLLTATYSSSEAYGNSSRLWSVLFFPAIEVSVREDKGAVVATVSMHSESCPVVTGQPCSCDNTAHPKQLLDSDSNLNHADPVMLINGGRPF